MTDLQASLTALIAKVEAIGLARTPTEYELAIIKAQRYAHELATLVPSPPEVPQMNRCDRCDDTVARKCFHEGCQRYDRHDVIRPAPEAPEPEKALLSQADFDETIDIAFRVVGVIGATMPGAEGYLSGVLQDERKRERRKLGTAPADAAQPTAFDWQGIAEIYEQKWSGVVVKLNESEAKRASLREQIATLEKEIETLQSKVAEAFDDAVHTGHRDFNAIRELKARAERAEAQIATLEQENAALRDGIFTKPLAGMTESEVRFIAGAQRDLRGADQLARQAAERRADKAEAALRAYGQHTPEAVEVIRALISSVGEYARQTMSANPEMVTGLRRAEEFVRDHKRARVVVPSPPEAPEPEKARLHCGCEAGQLHKATCPTIFGDPRTSGTAPADAAALRKQIDLFWEFIANAYDIEPREYFEREAPKNGFGSPLAQAAHHIWKRDPKVAALREQIATLEQEKERLTSDLARVTSLGPPAPAPEGYEWTLTFKRPSSTLAELDGAVSLVKCQQRAERAEAQIATLEQALDNHLCEFDKADWLACAGGHGVECEVCDQADNGMHRHALLKRAERAEAQIATLEADLADVRYVLNRPMKEEVLQTHYRLFSTVVGWLNSHNEHSAAAGIVAAEQAMQAIWREKERAGAALRAYGQHKSSCELAIDVFGNYVLQGLGGKENRNCTCGFASALQAGAALKPANGHLLLEQSLIAAGVSMPIDDYEKLGEAITRLLAGAALRETEP